MRRWVTFIALVAVSCQMAGLSPSAFATPYPPEYPSTVVAMTAEALTSPAPVVVEPATSTLPPPKPTFTSSPTLAPYEQYTIDYLRRRVYGGGSIEMGEIMEETDQFTRYLIRYPSDGLTIYGFMNIPKGDGPFPVILVLHGLAIPATYNTLSYTTEMADTITRSGYIVIHPNMRGHLPSDSGDNLFRVGVSIDVLNLIALVKSQGSRPGPLEQAIPDRIGLWGHSMGGGIALRVLTISSDIKAAVLYSSLSGDEVKNAQLLYEISPVPQFQIEMSALPDLLQRISPMYYYNNITAPIQIYHGAADKAVPISWAEENCELLTQAGVLVNCIYYPNEGHTFQGSIADEFYANAFKFYKAYLSP